jgi:hypothetical protein
MVMPEPNSPLWPEIGNWQIIGQLDPPTTKIGGNIGEKRDRQKE